MTGEFDLCWWLKIGACRVQKPMLMFLWKVNFSSAKNWGEGSTFPVIYLPLLHVSFYNTALAYLSVNTRPPPYYFKRFGLFALPTPVAILMSWRLLMTPPAILVPKAMSLTFFSIQESNRLGLPMLLVTVRSPSLHFFFQGLTAVLIKKYFWYLVLIFLMTEAVPKSLTYRPGNFFLDLCRNFDLIFFGRLYVFCISSVAKASSAKVRFSDNLSIDKNLHIRIPFKRLLCSPLTFLYYLPRFYTLSIDKKLSHEEFQFELQ